MNFFKNRFLFIFVFFLFLIVPFVSLAQPGNTNTNTTSTNTQDPVSLENPIAANSIPELIQKVLEGIVKIGIPIIALAIIYSGFLYVFAMGKPEKISEAHNALLYTLLGAVILLGAWGLSQIIVETVSEL